MVNSLKIYIYVCLLSVFTIITNYAQSTGKEPFAVQFSGVVVTNNDKTGDAIPLPYTNIYVKGKGRGIVAGSDGFFSIVALRGDVICFSFVGFKTVNYKIPDTLNVHYYSVYQIMSKDNILLPETVIYPWPRKEFFKQEILAMDISDELRKQAEENLAEKVMKEMIKDVPFDGYEASNLQLNRLANKAVYAGQVPYQGIFDINAWQKFIKAWKRGDFKRKKE